MLRPTSAAPVAGAMMWRTAFAGLCALLVGIGLARFAYTPLIPVLIAASWFTPSEAAYLGAANLAGYLGGAAAARRLAIRFSAPAVLRAAMAIAAVTFLACAWNPGFWWFFPWRFASGFVGAVLMVLSAPTALAQAVPGRRGRVGGIVFTGVGLGIAVSGTIVPALAGSGVTAVWFGLAGASAVLTALAWPNWPAAAPRPAAGPARERVQLSAPVVLLLSAYACDGLGFVPHTVFWVDYLARGLDLGLEVGGAYWILFGLGAAAGPIVAGLLADRVGLAASFALAMLVKGLGVALPLLDTGPVALAASSVVVGALVPGTSALLSARTAELVGPRPQQRVWGWMTGSFALAQAAGAYAFAWLFDRTESYAVLFALGAGALGAGAVLAACARSPRT